MPATVTDNIDIAAIASHVNRGALAGMEGCGIQLVESMQAMLSVPVQVQMSSRFTMVGGVPPGWYEWPVAGWEGQKASSHPQVEGTIRSAPGEAPRRETGELQASIATESRIMPDAVWLFVYTDCIYSPELENKMDRPHWAPLFKEMQASLPDLIREGISHDLLGF